MCGEIRVAFVGGGKGVISWLGHVNLVVLREEVPKASQQEEVFINVLYRLPKCSRSDNYQCCHVFKLSPLANRLYESLNIKPSGVFLFRKKG